MAQFCTKCGAPMGDGMQFCTSCGATTAAAPAPAAQVPVAATPASPVAVAPAPVTPTAPVSPAPPKSGSPVVKIIVIVVGVMVLLGVLAAASCAFMIYRAKQRMHQFSEQIESSIPIQTLPSSPGQSPSENPGGAPAVDMGDLGYPGATAGHGSSQSLFGQAGIKVQEYFTSDSIDAVVAYYRNKLGSNAMVTQNAGNAVVQIAGGGSLTTIHIATDTSSGKTKITISSISKQ